MNDLRYLIIALFAGIATIFSCDKVISPFNNLAGDYACDCERFESIFINNTVGWEETTDSIFVTKPLEIIDSTHFNFWDGQFICSLEKDTVDCTFFPEIGYIHFRLYTAEKRIRYIDAKIIGNDNMRVVCICGKID